MRDLGLILRSSPEQGGVKRNSTLDFKRLTLTTAGNPCYHGNC